MSEWITAKLGDVCEVVRGGSPRPIMDFVTDNPDGVNWLKIGDVSEHDKYFTHSAERITLAGTAKSRAVKKGDLILSNSMSFGRVFITLIDGYIHDGWLRIRNNEELLDKEYLYYFLSSDFAQNQFKAVATGSVVNNLKSDTVKAVEIRLPPLDTQRKIAGVLSALDDKIALNNKMNANLEEQARTLFKNWFVDFAPFGGKMPSGWKIKTIGDYIVPKRGKNLLSKDAIRGDVPVVAGGLEPAAYHNIANTNAPVITISASGANAGFVKLWNIPVWSSDSSYIDSEMTKNVYFWYVLLKSRQKEISDSQTGSAQPHIYPQHIQRMSIKELNEDKVNEFTKLVTPLFNQLGENQRQSRTLATLRDTLLPKLMNGEISVENVAT